MMKKILAVCCVLVLSTALGASAAEPQPAKAAGAVPAAPATPPAAPAPAKPPAAGSTQASEPDRIEPTEKVRADSEISFPVDI